MIGRKEWFEEKTFGFGITPVTWQGWVYVLLFITVLSFLILQGFWSWEPGTKTFVIISWVILFAADVIHIWVLLLRK